jgi:Fe-S-cluster containining protein
MSIIADCRACDAYCCRHVAISIDTPKTKMDYDTIRWYLMHENIWVSIDHNGHWLLEMRSPCKHIDTDYKCTIYENRPKICADYPLETELCERQTEELSYKHLFKNEQEYESYLNEKKIDWRWKAKGRGEKVKP